MEFQHALRRAIRAFRVRAHLATGPQRPPLSWRVVESGMLTANPNHRASNGSERDDQEPCRRYRLQREDSLRVMLIGSSSAWGESIGQAGIGNQ